jgi:hypothetical protein
VQATRVDAHVLADAGVGDDRLSGGLAGVAGVLMVGVLGGGLFWVLRRRDGDDAAPDHRDS